MRKGSGAPEPFSLSWRGGQRSRPPAELRTSLQGGCLTLPRTVAGAAGEAGFAAWLRSMR